MPFLQFVPAGELAAGPHPCILQSSPDKIKFCDSKLSDAEIKSQWCWVQSLGQAGLCRKILYIFNMEACGNLLAEVVGGPTNRKANIVALMKRYEKSLKNLKSCFWMFLVPGR